MPANTHRASDSGFPAPSGGQEVTQRRHRRFNFLDRFGFRGTRDPVSLPARRSPSGQTASPTTSSMVVDSPGGRLGAAWRSESSLAPAGVEQSAGLQPTPRMESGFGGFDGMPTAAVASRDREERTDAYHSWQAELRAQSQVDLGSSAAGLGSPMSPQKKSNKLFSFLPFRPRPPPPQDGPSKLSSKSMVNLDSSRDHDSPIATDRPSSRPRRLPHFRRAPPRHARLAAEPLHRMSRITEASQRDDRAESRAARSVSSSAELDVIAAYAESQASAPSRSRPTTALTRPLSIVSSRSSLYRHSSPIPPPAAVRPPPQSIEDQLLAQVQETIARLQSMPPESRSFSEAQQEILRQESEKLSLMAAEKAEMDAKVAELQKSSEEQKEQFEDAKSRWSPDSGTTIDSTIEDIPSDEEPEIGVAKVAVVQKARFIPAGSVKVVGSGPPALNRRQREERDRANAMKVPETATDAQAEQFSPGTAHSSDDTSSDDGEDKKKEPFPVFDTRNDPYDERNIGRAQGVQIDHSNSFARAWMNRHGDVRARPQTTSSDPAVAADNTIPPAPPRKDPNYTPSTPSSLSRPKNSPSPAGVPLPTSPDTPAHSYRGGARPGTPYNIRTSAMSTPRHPQTSSPAHYRPSPRGPAPTTPLSTLRLPRAPYGGHLAPMMTHTNASAPHLPPRTSSRLPPPGYRVPPPQTNTSTASVANQPGMTTPTPPRRQRCSSDTHSFVTIDARLVVLPGRNNQSPYQQHPSLYQQHPSPYQQHPSPYQQHPSPYQQQRPTSVQQRWQNPHHCESCGDVEDMYMKCCVAACGLVLCNDCARMMDRFAEVRREAKERK